nr:MAG TPA: hypothetical protein [Caudoviricetes sp.]
MGSYILLTRFITYALHLRHTFKYSLQTRC